ncbi:unnamed protein product [Larinioides sclopetarius]|uniref:Uncharacterized protein n=1 Tax=Larinioides sclopetarius TaxID=280406 RepID=A0AAV1ZA23_9ARAC
MSLCKPPDLPNLDMMKYESRKPQAALNLTWEEVISFTNSLKQNIKPNESRNLSNPVPKSEIPTDVSKESRFSPHSSLTAGVSISISTNVSERNIFPEQIANSKILSVVKPPSEITVTKPWSDMLQREPSSDRSSVVAIADNDDAEKIAGLKQNKTLKNHYTVEQWSRLNPEGKKEYSRKFLLTLQFHPMSLRKPEDLQNLDLIKYELYKDHIQKHTKNRTKPLPVLNNKRKDSEPFMPEDTEAEYMLTVVAVGSPTPPAQFVTKVTPATFSTTVSERNHSPQPIMKYRWSLLNPEGKRQYEREFLLQLQFQPTSLCKPYNLPNLDMIKRESNKDNIRKLHKNKREPSPVVNNGMRKYESFRPGYASDGPTSVVPQNLYNQVKEKRNPRKGISLTNSRNHEIKLNESRNNLKSPTESDIPPDNIWIPSSKYHLRKKFDNRSLSENTNGASVFEDGSTSISDSSTLR